MKNYSSPSSPKRCNATRRRFLPGADAGWIKTRPRSFWREGEVLLNLLRDTLWPKLSIKDCLENWTTIQCDLSEGHRNRVPRIKALLS